MNPIKYIKAMKLGLVGSQAVAAVSEIPEGVAVITPAPGDRFEVTIPIDGDKKFHGLGFYVTWPTCVKPVLRTKTGSETLEPTWAPGDIWAGRSVDAAVNLIGGGSSIYVSISVDQGQVPVSGEGKNFVTLTFEASAEEGEGSISISDVKPMRWKADGSFERLTCDLGTIDNYFSTNVIEEPPVEEEGIMIVRVVVRKL